MNPKIKAKWIKALTSGEYKQCKGTLSKGKTFCCLGVLCDLAPERIRPKIGRVDGKRRMVNSNGEMEVPGSEHLKWANLPFDEAKALAQMNDSGESFETIATYIRNFL